MMKDFWDDLTGWKTHILCTVGTAAILIGHFGNIDYPGFEINHHTWLHDIFQLGMVSALRHALSTKA